MIPHMASKKPEIKQESPLFTKGQILVSKKYSDRKDVCTAVIPDDFHGTLKDADALIEKFMKGKVK